MSVVVQRIAVISSPKAAGYQDFINHLAYNNYGIRFAITLFEAAVQGTQAVAQITAHLATLNALKNQFDAVCILRGGGSRVDLAAFDDYQLCAAIARTELPVLTGIGHETDESIADMVSHNSLKTPTAVADFLLDQAVAYWQTVAAHWAKISLLTTQIIQEKNNQLQQLQTELRHKSEAFITQKETVLVQNIAFLQRATPFYFDKKQAKINELEALIAILHPDHAFKRGFSMTMLNDDNHTLLTNADAVPVGTAITTILQNGTIQSIVE